MILMLDNERLLELIPNVIHEVKGETLLYNKLLPWLEQAKGWLEQHFLGADFYLPDMYYESAELIVVRKAFAEAIPSLDVTLSPSGFAVINTDGRAPASKERIERLIASLNNSVDKAVEILMLNLLSCSSWIESPMGQWWRSTFIPDISIASRFKGAASTLTDTYLTMREHALRFEQEVAESYMGENTLALIREQQYRSPLFENIIQMIRGAELRYISPRMRAQGANRCPDEHEVWHLIRPVLAALKTCPELYAHWFDEIGHRLKPEPFKNDVKGGYYF